MWILPDEVRADLARPMGAVRSGDEAVHEATQPIIVVGDVVTKTFLDAGVVPKLMIVDGHTQRETGTHVPTPEGATEVRVNNQAATISDELYQAIIVGVSQRQPVLVRVEGEEDLATLPALLLAPDGATVAYGQPGEGVVLIGVDAASRNHAKDILNRMEVRH